MPVLRNLVLISIATRTLAMGIEPGRMELAFAPALAMRARGRSGMCSCVRMLSKKEPVVNSAPALSSKQQGGTFATACADKVIKAGFHAHSLMLMGWQRLRPMPFQAFFYIVSFLLLQVQAVQRFMKRVPGKYILSSLVVRGEDREDNLELLRWAKNNISRAGVTHGSPAGIDKRFKEQETVTLRQ